MQSSHDEAERCFRESLDLARMQGAGSYELRTVTDLAALVADQGHRKKAGTLLRQVYDRFTEGFETADLKAAANLMSTLA
jgi:hypothetical protein